MRDSSTTRSNVLQTTNARLWSGLHPNALALLYDDMHSIGIGAPGAIRSEVAAVMIDALRDDAGQHQLETTVLRLVQEIHWMIHGAFTDYQNVSEQRRQLACGHRRGHRSIYGCACRGGIVRGGSATQTLTSSPRSNSNDERHA